MCEKPYPPLYSNSIRPAPLYFLYSSASLLGARRILRSSNPFHAHFNVNNFFPFLNNRNLSVCYESFDLLFRLTSMLARLTWDYETSTRKAQRKYRYSLFRIFSSQKYFFHRHTICQSILVSMNNTSFAIQVKYSINTCFCNVLSWPQCRSFVDLIINSFLFKRNKMHEFPASFFKYYAFNCEIIYRCGSTYVQFVIVIVLWTPTRILKKTGRFSQAPFMDPFPLINEISFV